MYDICISRLWYAYMIVICELEEEIL